MGYKLVYTGKTKNYDAFVYDIDGLYSYVVVDYNDNVGGPYGPYEDLDIIKSRVKLENPTNYDNAKEKRAEIAIQQALDYLESIASNINKEHMSKFNI